MSAAEEISKENSYRKKKTITISWGAPDIFRRIIQKLFGKLIRIPGPLVEETGGRKILTENKRCQKLEKAAAVRAEMIPQFLQLYAATESGCVIKHDSRQNFV